MIQYTSQGNLAAKVLFNESMPKRVSQKGSEDYIPPLSASHGVGWISYPFFFSSIYKQGMIEYKESINNYGFLN